MASVGDRIRLTLNKGADREGVVTGITGSLLRVRWASDEETTVIPAPGTLTVLGRTARKAPRPRKQTTAAATKSATKKVDPKKTPSKGPAARKKAGTAKKGSTKTASPKKAQSGQRSHSRRRSSG